MVYKIKRDGKVKAIASTENDAFIKLQKLQGFSADYAMRYAGWSIELYRGNKLIGKLNSNGQLGVI